MKIRTAAINRPKTLAGIHVEYLSSLVVLHSLALLALLPWCFTWAGFWTMVVGVFVIGQGVTLTYHRLLTHRCFRVPLWFERTLVTLSVICLEGSPASWVATHRLHHQHSDTQADAHSPAVSILWGHIGWIARQNAFTQGETVRQRYAADVLADPYYRALESRRLRYGIYAAHGLVFFAVGLLVGALAGGTLAAALQVGASLVVWGVFLRTVMVWQLTWAVNSIGHRFGYQNHDTGDASRNNLILGYLTLGEGWHNNHHHDQASASNRHRWWEFDLTYAMIRAMGWLGLASEIVPPRHTRHAARSLRLSPALREATVAAHG